MITCEYAYDDGAYVLGALAPAERVAYERHLTECDSCRESVAEIAVLPGLLSKLDAAGLERITSRSNPEYPPLELAPPPPRITAITPPSSSTSRRRQRRANRWQYAGMALVAAALALLAGAGVGWLRTPTAPPDPNPNVQLSAMKSVKESTPVSAEVGLRETKWGTEITMRCVYQKNADAPASSGFRLVVHGRDNTTEQVMSWVAGPGDEVTLTGVVRLSPDELTQLELVRTDGVSLLVYDVN